MVHQEVFDWKHQVSDSPNISDVCKWLVDGQEEEERKGGKKEQRKREEVEKGGGKGGRKEEKKGQKE